MEQELKFEVFNYSNFNEGVFKGHFFWVLSVNSLVWCVGFVYIQYGKRENFMILNLSVLQVNFIESVAALMNRSFIPSFFHISSPPRNSLTALQLLRFSCGS
jgi:hypothetical protein